MGNSKQAQAKKEQQIVNPGPSKELWDEALTRHGLDPEKVTEYNVPDETARDTNKLLQGVKGNEMNTEENGNATADDAKTIDQLDSEQKEILFVAMRRSSLDPVKFFGESASQDK